MAFFLEFVFLLTIKYLTSGDFFCWWPVSGVFAFFLAFWVRLQAHIVTNFAPFTEHRLPINSGGLFWIMSIVWSITSNFIYIYASYQFSDLCLEELKLNTCTPIEMSTMLSIYALGALVCLFILLLFFLSIKKSHWGTFFSTESSKQYNIRTCWQSKEDSLKCEALLKHASFRPDAEDVRKWMEENWLEWEEEVRACESRSDESCKCVLNRQFTTLYPLTISFAHRAPRVTCHRTRAGSTTTGRLSFMSWNQTTSPQPRRLPRARAR